MNSGQDTQPGFSSEIEKLRKRVSELEGMLDQFREADNKASENAERLAGLYEQTPDLVQILGPDSKLTYVNRGWRETLGYSLEEARNLYFTDILRRDDVLRWKQLFQHLVHEESSLFAQVTLKTRRGKFIRLEGDFMPVMKDGQLIRINTVYRCRSRINKSVWDRDRFFLSSLDLLFIVGFDRTLKRANPAFERALGYRSEELAGKPLLDFVHPEDRKVTRKELRRLRAGIPSLSFENRFIGKDGSFRWLAWTSHSVTPEGVIYAVARDVTDKKRMEHELRRLSYTDELTKLYNRRGFRTFTEKIMKLARREKRGFMVAYLDLDGLKEINDTFGHAEGDRALKRVAEVLQKVFRGSDVLARIGGDEFAISALINSGRACERIEARLKRLMTRENQERPGYYYLSFSFGCVYWHPDTDLSLDELIGQADNALYHDKKENRSRSVITQLPLI